MIRYLYWNAWQFPVLVRLFVAFAHLDTHCAPWSPHAVALGAFANGPKFWNRNEWYGTVVTWSRAVEHILLNSFCIVRKINVNTWGVRFNIVRHLIAFHFGHGAWVLLMNRDETVLFFSVTRDNDRFAPPSTPSSQPLSGFHVIITCSSPESLWESLPVLFARHNPDSLPPDSLHRRNKFLSVGTVALILCCFVHPRHESVS